MQFFKKFVSKCFYFFIKCISVVKNICIAFLYSKNGMQFVKKIIEKSKDKILALNVKILHLTEILLLFYNKKVSVKIKSIYDFIRNTLRNCIFLIKKAIFFVVEFYKKDKKRAIIYFIVLYVIYKVIFGIAYRISTLFQVHKNEMIVSVREVKPEIIEKNVNCYGYLESENTLQYSSEVRGNIDKIFVKEKQFVKEGQLLMVLDSKFTANSYTSAKSILESKKFQYNAIKKLYQDGLESKGNLKAMEADLESANSNFESAKKAYNGLMIHAPFDGYIDNIKNKEGAQINPGTSLFTLERMNAMQVKCDVQNLSTHEVRVDDDVKIFVSGHEVASGKISVIGDSVDVYTGSRGIIVNRIAEETGFEDKIRPGMSVMIKIKAKSQQSVYKISSEALETTETGAFMVKILNPYDGEILKKNIWIYDEQDGMNYVLGLSDNDYVVERGHEFVDVGEKDIQYTKVNEEKNKANDNNFYKFLNFCANIYNGSKMFVRNFPEFYAWSKNYYREVFIKLVNRIYNVKSRLSTIADKNISNGNKN